MKNNKIEKVEEVEKTKNNTKNEIINKKNNQISIKTTVHDVAMIQKSIDNIKTKFENFNNITLLGDL